MGVRAMRPGDLSEVMEIEEEAFDTPWDVDEMVQILRNGSAMGLVYIQNSRVLGYVVFHRMGTSYYILDIAVAEHHRRRQIGSRLITGVIIDARLHQARRVEMYISDRNLVGHLFAKRHHFKAIQVCPEDRDYGGHYRFQLRLERGNSGCLDNSTDNI